MQKFKYNCVKLEESVGFDLYEMDVRSYDSAIAGWISIDQVTHYEFSPYQAFDNDHIFYADSNGADSQIIYDFDGNPWSVDCENGEYDSTRRADGSDDECLSCETEEDWGNYYSQARNTTAMLGEDPNFGGNRLTVGYDENGKRFYYLDGESMDLVKP